MLYRFSIVFLIGLCLVACSSGSMQEESVPVIPFVNFIMLLVWAFSAGTPVSKANWAKATLIFMLIGFVLVILFWGAIGGLLLSNM